MLMAFLRGTMTYEELLDGKLFELLAGEISDDFAVTAPVGERWERINATTLGCPGDSINNPTNVNNINMRLGFSGETASQEAVSLTVQCKRPVDGGYGTTSTTMRLRIFTNGALVNSTDLLAYWMSVTDDRIILAIQGDTNHSGNMNLAYIGTYTRLYTASEDPFPVMMMVSHLQGDDMTYAPYNNHARSQVCRIDNAGWLEDRNATGHVTATASSLLGANPNIWDSKWYLYTLYIVSARTTDNAAHLGYRGKMLDLYVLSSSSWSNRDILTDGIDSWRLIFPFSSNSLATSQTPQNLGNSGLIYFAFKQT